jgi:hypothetical protein
VHSHLNFNKPILDNKPTTGPSRCERPHCLRYSAPRHLGYADFLKSSAVLLVRCATMLPGAIRWGLLLAAMTGSGALGSKLQVTMHGPDPFTWTRQKCGPSDQVCVSSRNRESTRHRLGLIRPLIILTVRL